MVEYIPAPEPRSLLPPLLACLPAGFASPRPPPALLPLLSPILRQRVQLLSSISSSSSDSWIRLLCWNPSRGEQIERIVGEASFEPHPVSGEIEIPDDVVPRYKRVDPETLRAHFPLTDYNLVVVYVWCPEDEEGGGPGWRVTEILHADSLQDETHTWTLSIGEANELRQKTILREALKHAEDEAQLINEQSDDGGDEDDDHYWAQYDDNLGRTPMRKDSPALNNPRLDAAKQHQEASDASYYSRYNEVQPAMDNDDPSVHRNEIGHSSPSGDAVGNILRQQIEQIINQNGFPRPPPAIDISALGLSHPRPQSASSRGSDAVLRLEQTAENQSTSELGVRDHISSNIRSLYRLARCTGVSGEEFRNLVQRELDRLSCGFE
ncbi:hypothetical protein PRK78_003934 [Emydomyces testavorans]|uniref:Uncharacterized protein n=1 Tax=Emydomyces testavorans TaxID=2070801 RepID=A0AAF0IJ93_9EURO|nr:hypothetical protein PRK78_003934 [Emydomyces testavorans]